MLVPVGAGLRDEDHLVDAGRLVALRSGPRPGPACRSPRAGCRAPAGGAGRRAARRRRVTISRAKPDLGAALRGTPPRCSSGPGGARRTRSSRRARSRRSGRRRSPARSPSASSRWHIIGSTTATLGLTAKPAGTHSSDGDQSRSRRPPTPSPPRARRTRTRARRCPARAASQDRLAPAARDPQRRVGLLLRLRDDVSRRHRDPAAVVAGERLLDEHPRDRVERLLPLGALQLTVDAEPAQLDLRAPLAGPELDPAAGDQVERRDPLGDPRRVVDGGRHLHDPVAEADAARSAGWRRRGTPPGALECEYSSRKWCSTSHT